MIISCQNLNKEKQASFHSIHCKRWKCPGKSHKVHLVPEQDASIACTIDIWIVLPFGYLIQPYPGMKDKTIGTRCRPFLDVQYSEAIVSVLNVDKLGTDILIVGHILQSDRCQCLRFEKIHTRKERKEGKNEIITRKTCKTTGNRTNAETLTCSNCFR